MAVLGLRHGMGLSRVVIPCCGGGGGARAAWVLGLSDSVVATRGLRTGGSWARGHGLSSCDSSV